MSDNAIARLEAAVASGKLSPEKLARVQAELDRLKGLAASAPKPAGDVPEVRGEAPKPPPVSTEKPPPGMGDLRVAEAPKSGGAVAIGPAVHLDRDPVEIAHEVSARRSDENPQLMSASKRRSLYAEPMYEGDGKYHGRQPFVHFEPKPENVADQLAAYRDKAPAHQRADIDKAIADIQKNGKKSRHYQEAADRIWMEVRTEFQRDGLPVQRVEHAPVTSYRTGVNKVAGTVAAPILYGAEQAALLGAGTAAWPSATQDIMSGSSPEEAAVRKRLEERGVLPSGLDARGQEYDPKLSLFGGVAGMMVGGVRTPGGQAMRAGMKAETLPWLRGTTLGSRLARSAAGGVVSGAVAGGASQAVTETSEALRGEGEGLGDSAKEIGSRALTDSLIGGVASPLFTATGHAYSTASKRIGRHAQDKLRMKDGVGSDIIQAEVSGAGTTHPVLGMKRTPEATALEREALNPVSLGDGVKVAQTKSQAATRPVADAALTSRFKRTQAEKELMGRNNEEGYARLGNKSVDTRPLFDDVLNVVRQRKNVPFAQKSIFQKALNEMSDVKVVQKTDPRIQDPRVRTFSLAEAQELGIQARVEPHMRNDRWVVVAEPKPMTAKQLDDSMHGLAESIDWGKEAGSHDAELKRVYGSLVQMRERFGSAWAATKKQHDEILRQRAEDMETLGFPKNHELEVSDAERSRVHGVYERFGSADIADKKRMLRVLDDNPDMKRRANLHAGNAAIDRLTGRAAAGDTVTKTGLMRKAADLITPGSSIHTDPIFGALGRFGASNEQRSAVLRRKLQETLGPGVQVPDSLLDYVAQMLNVSAQTAGESP